MRRLRKLYLVKKHPGAKDDYIPTESETVELVTDFLIECDDELAECISLAKRKSASITRMTQARVLLAKIIGTLNGRPFLEVIETHSKGGKDAS